MRAYNFGISGSNIMKLYQATWRVADVITWVQLLEGMHKIGDGKNVQNSARFLITFDFDREYLGNGSTKRKSEKYMIDEISSPIGQKKYDELWSANKKSYSRAC